MKYVKLFENYKSGIEKFNSTRAKKEWGQLKNKTFTAENTSYGPKSDTWKFSAPSKKGKDFYIKLKCLDRKEEYIDVYVDTKNGSRITMIHENSNVDYGNLGNSELHNQEHGQFIKELNDRTGSNYGNFHDVKPLAYAISKYFKQPSLLDDISSLVEETPKKVTKKEINAAEEEVRYAKKFISSLKSSMTELDDIIMGRNWNGGSLSARDFGRYNRMGSHHHRELDRRRDARERKEDLEQRIFDAERDLIKKEDILSKLIDGNR